MLAHHKEWCKYFEGSWNYDVTLSKDLNGKGELIYSMAPTGDALTAQWKNENGKSSYAVMGWQADSKTVVVTGHGSDRSYWQNAFDKFTGETQEGSQRGVLSDGTTYEGRIVITKVDSDNCKWEFTGKNGDGEEHSMNGKMTRKKSDGPTPLQVSPD